MDINLAPSGSKPKRPHHTDRPIEYSTVAPEKEEKEHKRSFLRWRKDRQRKSKERPPQATPPNLISQEKVAPTPPPPPPPSPPEKSPDLLQSFQEKDSTLGLHRAPRHEREHEAPDLVSAATTPKETSEHGAPRGKKDEAPDLMAIRAGEERKRGRPFSPPPPKEKSEPPVPGINLIPDHLLAASDTHSRFRDLLYVALSVVAFILFLYGGLNIYQRKITVDTDQINTEIIEMDQEIAEFEQMQREALVVEDRLDAALAVLNAHIYWTPFLEEVEALTLPTVYYESVHGSAVTGGFVFEAVAADYSQIASQIRLMRRSSFVKEVSSTSASTASIAVPVEAEEVTTSEAELLSSPVEFTMTVAFDSSLFRHPTLRSHED